jgi:Ca-activated chloride channel family protein
MFFQFARVELLFLLLLIPVIIVVYIVSNNYKKKLFRQYGETSLMDELMPDRSPSRPNLKLTLFLIALAFFILAIAGPQFGSKLENKKMQGVEIMIALDVSNSMMAEDIKPNRLERAKQAISKLVDRLKEDKLGMIVFAGDAMTQLPITADYVSAKMFLSSISPDLVPIQGTAIGKAIKLATVSFTPNGTSDKAIIVITDGENHEDDALEAVKAAREKGIYVYSIGIGSLEGTPIPVNSGSGQVGFIKDEQGQVVVTKLDEVLLEKIADEGEGIYVRANNSQVGLNTIFDKIKNLKKGEFKSKVYSEYKNQYQWPLAIAFIILIIELIILERKTKWSKRINLFQVK